MDNRINENLIKGQLFYRNCFDVILIGCLCFFFFADAVLPKINCNFPPVLILSPLIFLCLIRNIPVYYCFENKILIKKIGIINVQKIDFSKAHVIYYLSTNIGCAFLIENNEGRKISKCKSLFGVIGYLLLNRKNSCFIPFNEKDKNRFFVFFNIFPSDVIDVRGGFITVIMTNIANTK